MTDQQADDSSDETDSIDSARVDYPGEPPVQKWECDGYTVAGSVALESAVYNPSVGRLAVNLTRSQFDHADRVGQQFTFPATVDGDYNPGDGSHTLVVDASNLSPRDRASTFENALRDLLDALDGVRVNRRDSGD